MSLGREQLPWSDDVWSSIDTAVNNEVQRTCVAAKIIPLLTPAPSPDVATVPADLIDSATMTVDESTVTPIVELGVEFRLTRQQIGNEADVATAVSLATRAANLLARAEDVVLFQGESGLKDPLLSSVKVAGGSPGAGLLSSADLAVPVAPVGSGAYGKNTFVAFANAYSQLQSKGQYGPYALVVRSEIYADAYAPLPDTLGLTADSIKPMVPLGFYGTATLPLLSGVLVSVGGNTMDLVSSFNPTTEFLQIDPDGEYRFKVFERFALRVKDKTAIVRFEFRK
jgi:uncharacterized linocin/CFP29 family protein